jgi:hypothetical protein
VLLLALALVALGGCGKGGDDESEQGENGGRSLVRFSATVNGLTVLGDMFTAAGHTVSLRKKLSPVLQEACDVIVWAPDDFNVPDEQTCDQLDRWLCDKEGRTLIYIGHDFDARPLYWRKILAKAPPVDQAQYQKELDEAESTFQAQRAARPQHASCSLFDLNTQAAHRDIRSLDGPWAEGIDASKTEIELNSRLVKSDDADMLLEDGPDAVLVTRQEFDCLKPKIHSPPGTSHLLVVANGSFLFNVPLVNHEHRKLAGRLIEEVGKAKHVVILDSQNHHPISLAGDKNNPPEQTPQSMLDVFDVWPLSAILVQWGLLIVLLCFAKWPIFGPPRDPPPPPASDFGRHVAALGAAMAVTGDAEYAQSRVQQYRQLRDATGPRAINRTNTKRI